MGRERTWPKKCSHGVDKCRADKKSGEKIGLHLCSTILNYIQIIYSISNCLKIYKGSLFA